MEEEIDKIFLTQNYKDSGDKKIQNLKLFSDKIPTFYPYFDHIVDQVDSLRKHFSVYDIQLESLAKDLKNIQDRSKKIEEKHIHETEVYNRLKELCIVLGSGSNEFYILENGSFSNYEDLGKMERDLSIIGSVDLGEYTIRVVKERKSEIIKIQNNFLKRFEVFLRQLLIKSECSGELKVHRELYKAMIRYKFIFEFARNYPEQYSVLCYTYAEQARRLYEMEFDNHIKSITKMVKSADTLGLCFNVLTKGYESLVGCEINFLRDAGIDASPDDIFKNVAGQIVEFISDMYKRSALGTLIPMSTILTKFEPCNLTCESFKNDMNREYKVLEQLYLKSQEEMQPTFIMAERINLVLDSDCAEEFKNKLLGLWISKLVKNIKNIKIDEFIHRFQILSTIQGNSSELKDAISEMNGALPRAVISYIFSNGNEIRNTIEIADMIKVDKAGAEVILKMIEEIALENHTEDRKKKVLEIFESVRNLIEENKKN